MGTKIGLVIGYGLVLGGFFGFAFAGFTFNFVLAPFMMGVFFIGGVTTGIFSSKLAKQKEGTEMDNVKATFSDYMGNKRPVRCPNCNCPVTEDTGKFCDACGTRIE